jgi:hypothetical protein
MRHLASQALALLGGPPALINRQALRASAHVAAFSNIRLQPSGGQLRSMPPRSALACDVNAMTIVATAHRSVRPKIFAICSSRPYGLTLHVSLHQS